MSYPDNIKFCNLVRHCMAPLESQETMVEDFFKDELSDLDSEEETQEAPEPLG